jgi:hypothetical protein
MLPVAPQPLGCTQDAWCLRYVFGTLQNEWSSIFLPFIIFLILYFPVNSGELGDTREVFRACLKSGLRGKMLAL